jgi:gas vesicle protein
MVEEPDRIRDGIVATRSNLVRDVDELADRTMPNRIVRRRWEGMKDTMSSLSDKVMGTSRSAASSVGDAASTVGDKAEQIPHTIARQTEGNPIAAGVIAFGVGLLAASLVPTTEFERKAGRELKENGSNLVEPLREPMAESAQRIKDDLGGAVSDATESVKQRAKEAVQTTKDDAKAATQQVTDNN